MATPPIWYNQSVFRQLPDAKPQPRMEAYLVKYAPDLDEEQVLWEFLIAPSRLQFSRSAKYNENSTFAAKVVDRQYANTSGSTLVINNLEFLTWYYQKSMKPLIEGLMALLEIKEDTFAPPILTFVFGGRRFGPCVLTDVNWDESAWLGGEQASININLTLVEIPNPGLKRDAIASSIDPLGETDSIKPRNPLTLRQRQDASEVAKKYLQENREIFNQVISEAIRASAYFLETDENSGNVKMLDQDKKTIGIVGTWNGQDFSADTSTIPLK